jgi:hypothetical protein
MADVNKTIAISYEARTASLENALKRIPGVTQEQAEKMAKNLDNELKKAEKHAERASRNIGAEFKKAGKAVGMIAGGAAVAGAAIIAFGQHIADLANELTDASTKTGIAIETLGGLRLAAAGSGVEFGKLEGGLIKLTGSIAAAAEGSGPASDAFKALGISATDAEGNLRSSDEVFNEITETLSQVENQTLKNSLAMDIFGAKAGAALMQSGALDNMAAFNDLAREFGVNMEEAGNMAGTFQRAMAEVELVLQGVGANLLMSATGAEGLNNAIFLLSDAIVFFGSIAQDVVISAKGAFDFLSRSVEITLTYILGVARSIGAVFTGEFDKINDITTQTLFEVEQLSKPLTDGANAVLILGDSYEKANQRVSELRELRKDILEQAEKEAASEDRRRKSAAAASDQAKGAAAEALEASKAEAEARRAQAQAERELIAARKELKSITDASIQSQMTEEEIQLMKFEAERERILELGQIVQDEAAVKAALDAQEAERSAYYHNQKMKEIEKEKAARLQTLNIMVSSASTIAASLLAVQQNTGAFTAQQAKRIFRLGQTAAVSDIAINTAVAISKANAQLGPIAGGLATGALVASGAAQTAAVLSQPIPTYDMGGMIGNLDPLRPGERLVRAQAGEAILDEATVGRLGGESGIDALQRGDSPGDRVIVISPFKHLDRYNRSALRRGSVLTRRFKPQGSGAY